MNEYKEFIKPKTQKKLKKSRAIDLTAQNLYDIVQLVYKRR